jgi:glutathione S-transferase
MDSRMIASRLDHQYPNRPLNVDTDPNLQEITDIVSKISQAASPDFIYKIATNILGDQSLKYWHETRGAWFGGRQLAQVAAQQGGIHAYQEAQPLVARVTELLQQDPTGPFLQGRNVSYADFVWISLLWFFKNLDPLSFDTLIEVDKSVHLKLIEACRPWLERAGY